MAVNGIVDPEREPKPSQSPLAAQPQGGAPEVRLFMQQNEAAESKGCSAGAPMEKFLHTEFRCICGQSMALPADLLWELVPDQDRRSGRAPLIAIACPSCSRMDTYSWGSDGVNYSRPLLVFCPIYN